jgi:hypothetical protein
MNYESVVVELGSKLRAERKKVGMSQEVPPLRDNSLDADG